MVIGCVQHDCAKCQALATLISPIKLTKRELEILGFVTRGKTNGEIAKILGTSVLTVKNQIQRLLRKLNAVNRTSLAVAGVRFGYINPITLEAN